MEIYFLIKEGDEYKPNNSILDTDQRLNNHYKSNEKPRVHVDRIKSLRHVVIEFMDECKVKYALPDRGLYHEARLVEYEDNWVGYIFNVYQDYSYSERAGEIIVFLDEIEKAVLELVSV